MSAKSLFDPFPNMPNVTHLGDGRRLIETHDKGHAITMVEPDGSVSMVISKNPPSPPPKPVATGTFHVRRHEIIDPEGKVYATAADPEKADHIRKLLIVYEKMIAKKPSGS